MTFAPQSALDARHVFTRRYPNIPITDFGITGDHDHVLQGTGYHLGRDQLKMRLGPYSARTSRDLAGLSNAASALDVPNSIGILPELSAWMVAQCRAKAPDTLDIREIVFSPDGVAVLTWDRERGVTSYPMPRGSLSHRTHTHFSWYRDSEFHNRAAVFERFFNEREDMLRDEELTIPRETLLTGETLPPEGEHEKVDAATAVAFALRHAFAARRASEEALKIVKDLKIPLVTDEQLERVLRKIILSLPSASLPSA